MVVGVMSVALTLVGEPEGAEENNSHVHMYMIAYTYMYICIHVCTVHVNTIMHKHHVYMYIRESVDSLCRDETDAPMA